MQWIELSTSSGPDQLKAVTAILEKYGQGGAAVEEWTEDNGTQRFLIKIYLPLSRAYRMVKSEIDFHLNEAGFNQGLQEKVLRQDEWFESLHKNFKVMEIGDFYVIKPTWIKEELNYPGRVIIEMDPGAAFGTGLHPTTRLCLINLHKYLKRGMQVFDLGTGTGILAIAAVKLGAAAVLAVDVDPVAVKAAQANARLNGVNAFIKFKRGTLSARAQSEYQSGFDIVLANITSRAISDLSPGLAAILKPEGVLIVSGIHPEGLDEVLIRLSMADLKLINIRKEQDWYAVIAKKEPV